MAFKGINIKRLVSAVLMILLSLSCCLAVGCSGNNDFIIYFGVDKAPQNLDPQLAYLDSELNFVRNCFRGLYKLDSNDAAVPDLVTDCKLSSDQLTYTFKLGDCEWSNGDPVTAHDFRFAILRACDPHLDAPQVENIKNIVGITEALNGQSAEFGVDVLDEKTLTITLIKPDANFLLKLTKPIFMPCNENFFIKTGGKYGLDKQYILTNGNFKVSSWTNKKSLELKPADSEKSITVNKIVLTESQTGKLNSDRIKDHEIGMTIVSGEDYSSINASKYNVDVKYRKNYAIRFNKSSTIGQNQELLQALARCIDRDFIEQNMNDRFKSAYTCLPNDCLVLDSQNLDTSRLTRYGYTFSAEESRTAFLEAVKSFRNSKLPTLEILCPDDKEIKSILTNAVSGWQSNLGAVVNIKAVQSDSAIGSAVDSGAYSIAFVPLTGSAEEILATFENDTASSEYKDLISRLITTDNISEANTLIKSATDILSTDAAIIPIVGIPTAYVYSNAYKNVHFSEIDGTVDFSIITK